MDHLDPLLKKIAAKCDNRIESQNTAMSGLFNAYGALASGMRTCRPVSVHLTLNGAKKDIG